LSDRKDAIRRHLATTRALLIDAVAELSQAEWERPVAPALSGVEGSSEGAWTVRQVVAHLASAEPGQIATGQRMLAGEARLPESFRLDFWNQRQVEKRKDQAPADLLSDLSQSRQRLTAWIDGLSQADLDKSGQHARGDFITVAQLCFRIGEHEAQHADEIRRALGK
jgi:uncharacterized damage-inducible protein DinB